MNPTQRARELRHNMTVQERRLWSRLKRLRERGFHLRRQAPFRGYFLDFVCFDRRLIIEVDGESHSDDEQIEHDRIRTAVMEREGFVVLRFWNHVVATDLDAVMDQIVVALEDAPAARP